MRPGSCGGACSTRSRRSERGVTAAARRATLRQTQNIATAITEVSERATLLVREEIELAKAEVTEKATKLVKGAVVGVAAGVFLVTALFFVLIGCAWLLYYYLPIGNAYTYFWGFFAMAVILVVLGVIAGLIAARVGQKRLPAGAEHGDRRGAEDPRDGVRGRRCVTDRARDDRAGEDLMAQRSATEIRSSIEANREELAVSLVQLRGEVTHLTDWRGHIERHQRELKIGGAVVAGLVIGSGLLRRRRRNR